MTDMTENFSRLKYRDLPFQKAHISNSRKEFDRVHLGSHAPSASELSAITKEFARNAQELRVMYVGITSIEGAPIDPTAQKSNAILLLFTDKASLRNFLDQPVAPSMKDITLVLDVTKT